MTPRHGVPRHAFDDYSDDDLRVLARERGWEPEVYAADELRRRLTEAQFPIYKLPDFSPKAPRGVVVWALVNHLGEPYPDGVARADVIASLRRVGMPDDDTAEQTLRQQVLNLVEYYGYTVLRDDDERIIIAKR